MPTYLNASYMKMPNAAAQSQHMHQPPQPSEHSCLQILSHVQNCPICRHVFSPHENVMSGAKLPLNNPIEISFTSLLLVISLFIVLILLVIQK